MLFKGLVFLSSLTIVNSLSCISINNQECKVRPQIISVNEDEHLFYPFSIKTSKSSWYYLSIIHMQICLFLVLLKI